ncbi:MAG: GldG family protein [Oscillospiraceae bacterium]|nr:GldG family protein [Oscillospiraceae bacterium]
MSKKTNKQLDTEKLENKAAEQESVVGAPDLEAVVAAEAKKSSEKAEKNGSRKFNIRNFKRGTLAVVLTIVFIGVLILVNIIVGILSDRFNTSADLSTGGMYTIDEKTEDFVQKLEHDVVITVLNSESEFEAQGTVYKQVNEILKKLEIASEHISIDYLLLDQNPNFSSRFTGETLEANYIVVECPDMDRHRIITANEYVTVDQEAYYEAYYAAYYSGTSFNQGDFIYSNIEQEAVSAMMYVANDELICIAFTEGYGELDSTGLSSLLKKNGYEVSTINLMQVDEIDPELDFIVMFAPTMDVDNDNLTKLDKFLDNGGKFGKNVIYFASAQQPQTPNIEAFLNDWGMSVGYSVIGQTDTSYLMSSTMGLYAHYQNILDTNYAGTTYGNGLYTYGMDMRPVIQIWEDGTKGNVEQEIIMQSYDNAFLYPLDSEGDFTLDTAEKGIFNNAIVAYRVHSTTQEVSRLAVFGSDMLAYSYFMEYANSNNGTFLVNMFNYICGREEGITITPKSFAVTAFDMNAGTANVLAVVLCIVIPVIVIALGIVIWVRRRHR